MSKIVRKFKFSDLRLAFKVRENMFNALIVFDENQNQLFQAEEIRNALITILGEDELEVQYVIKNVFRYDTDGDNAVTYAQLTNFFVEQHFGEMAIQRLHRKGYYLNGNKRVMNLQQFQTTLNYCLQSINSKGTHFDYERLFKQVDLDRDGLISYQEYFIFLREYFGSQSQAFEEQEKNPRQIPPKHKVQIKVIPAPVYTDLPYSSAQEIFAKLIYSQFKISVMERDRNKNLILQKPEIDDIISNTLKLQYNQQSQLRDKCLNGSNNIKYDEFLRNALVNYMSDTNIQKINQQSLSQSQFLSLVGRTCHFVTIKPSDNVLSACFKQLSRGNSSVSVGQYKNMMRSIFQKYKFDTRGLNNLKVKTSY